MTNETVEIETAAAPASSTNAVTIALVALGFVLTVTSPLHLPDMSGAWSSIIGMVVSARMMFVLNRKNIWHRFAVAGFWLGLIVPTTFLIVLAIDIAAN